MHAHEMTPDQRQAFRTEQVAALIEMWLEDDDGPELVGYEIASYCETATNEMLHLAIGFLATLLPDPCREPNAAADDTRPL